MQQSPTLAHTATAILYSLQYTPSTDVIGSAVDTVAVVDVVAFLSDQWPGLVRCLQCSAAGQLTSLSAPSCHSSPAPSCHSCPATEDGRSGAAAAAGQHENLSGRLERIMDGITVRGADEVIIRDWKSLRKDLVILASRLD